MFWNILDEPRRVFLKKLIAASPLGGCYLAGGTSLALQFGHRGSEDFDWFSPRNFDPRTLADAVSGVFDGLTVDFTAPGTLHGRVGDIRVTWLHYPNPLLRPVIKPDDLPDLELASPVDIGLMKWAALADRGARKDFLDLYELAGQGIRLVMLYDLLFQKFSAARINEYHMIKSLSWFDDAEQDPWPHLYRAVDWQKLREYFMAEQKMLLDRMR